MNNTKFSMSEHRFDEPKYFEDLKIGDKFYIPSRTINEGNFAAFQTVSCDNHPIHYNVEYCKANGHRGLLAHGLQVLSFTAAGAGLFPHILNESLMGFIEQSSRFIKGVYAGDTLYPMLVISDLLSQRSTGVVTLEATIHNQKKELVLNGWHKYLVRKRNSEN